MCKPVNSSLQTIRCLTLCDATGAVEGDFWLHKKRTGPALVRARSVFCLLHIVRRSRAAGDMNRRLRGTRRRLLCPPRGEAAVKNCHTLRTTSMRVHLRKRVRAPSITLCPARVLAPGLLGGLHEHQHAVIDNVSDMAGPTDVAFAERC